MVFKQQTQVGQHKKFWYLSSKVDMQARRKTDSKKKFTICSSAATKSDDLLWVFPTILENLQRLELS